MGKLDGSLAIVTGGARGMGASHVRELVAEGARVVIADLLEDEATALATELGDATHFVRLDITDDDSWASALEETERVFGPVDVLVNNAGVGPFKPWLSTTAKEFQRVLSINLTGQFIGIRAVVPSMRRSERPGVIVNFSSTAGMQGFAAEPAYVSSKGGVRGLTKAAALEFAPLGIRVVSAHPGVVRTRMTVGVGEESYDQQPMPRMADPAEVTKMVLFLVADATSSSGSEFLVDGGAVLGPVVPVPFDA